MIAGLWVVGGPSVDDREDLRYSLRSVAAHTGITEAWVVGDVPAWFTGCRIPLPPHPSKFENQRASLTAFCETAGVPESFVLFNDDMFVTEPIAGALPIFRNRGRTSNWNADHDGTGHGPDCWTCACRDTATWATKHGAGDPHLYECHTPLTFDTTRLRDLLNAYPAGRRLAVGELYPLAGIGGEGTHAGNAKVKAHDSLADKLANPMPFLSSNPDTWPGGVADYIKPLFPDPSPWEAAVREEADHVV